jgi:hypothetical protein
MDIAEQAITTNNQSAISSLLLSKFTGPSFLLISLHCMCMEYDEGYDMVRIVRKIDSSSYRI